MTVRIFLLCLAAGAVGGTVNAALSPLRTRAGRVFTIVTDVLLALLSVGAHAAILYFYCDGRIFGYAVLAQALGFFVCDLLLRNIFHKVGNSFHKKLQKKKKVVRPLA